MAKSGVAKLVLSLCLLASVATAGGVYATWQLAVLRIHLHRCGLERSKQQRGRKD